MLSFLNISQVVGSLVGMSECFAPVKRLAGEIASEMTFNVSNGN